jgi:beta-lactam-binding protein with PASTA domain
MTRGLLLWLVACWMVSVPAVLPRLAAAQTATESTESRQGSQTRTRWVSVPPVEGLEAAVAADLLKQAGIKVRERRVPTDTSVGVVLKQDPAPGTLIHRASACTWFGPPCGVQVTIGVAPTGQNRGNARGDSPTAPRGSPAGATAGSAPASPATASSASSTPPGAGRTVPVPDLSRLPRSEVERRLAALDLTSQFETAPAADAPADVPPGTVVRHVPSAGAVVLPGSAVRVVLAPAQTPVPPTEASAQPGANPAQPGSNPAQPGSNPARPVAISAQPGTTVGASPGPNPASGAIAAATGGGSAATSNLAPGSDTATGTNPSTTSASIGTSAPGTAFGTRAPVAPTDAPAARPESGAGTRAVRGATGAAAEPARGITPQDRIRVPNLARLTRVDVERRLEQLGLLAEYTVEPAATPNATAGTVVRQLPEPDQVVPPRTTVRVVLARGTATGSTEAARATTAPGETPDGIVAPAAARAPGASAAVPGASVLMPELTRRARSDASALLAPLDLVPEFTLAGTVAPDAEPGTVVQQIPEAGAPVSRGTTVRVVLAPDGARVPNLAGLDRTAVEQQLASRRITPQFVTDVTASSGAAPGTVVRQVPPVGTILAAGATVQVVLAPAAQSGGGDGSGSDWWWLLIAAAVVAAIVALVSVGSHRAGKRRRAGVGAEPPPPDVPVPPGSPPPSGLQLESHTGDTVTGLALDGPALIAFKVGIRAVVDPGEPTLSVDGPLCRDVRRDV